MNEQLMKVEANVGAAAIRILKSEKRKAQRRSSAYDLSGGNDYRHFTYANHMVTQVNNQKYYLRHLHLLRAYLAGTPYSMVEQSVREGNEPYAQELLNVANHFGVTLSYTRVLNWFEEAA